ncbi:MAG: hypothetical protein MR828_04505 [Clostridiales bacterium]|nr:hypothetical protein [Clostridiales bacterium]
METINMNEKLQDLMNNKEFMESIHKTASIEEYQQLLAANGINTTVEELKAGFEQVSSLVGENGELSVEVLDAVAGGRGVNVLTHLGVWGQIGCTLAMMACATNPVGWYIAACACGAVALCSMC